MGRGMARIVTTSRVSRQTCSACAADTAPTQQMYYACADDTAPARQIYSACAGAASARSAVEATVPSTKFCCVSPCVGLRGCRAARLRVPRKNNNAKQKDVADASKQKNHKPKQK